MKKLRTIWLVAKLTAGDSRQGNAKNLTKPFSWPDTIQPNNLIVGMTNKLFYASNILV